MLAYKENKLVYRSFSTSGWLVNVPGTTEVFAFRGTQGELTDMQLPALGYSTGQEVP